MARGYSYADQAASAMTEYVTTRWYRAPEIMISPNNYSELSKLLLLFIIIVIKSPYYPLTRHLFFQLMFGL